MAGDEARLPSSQARGTHARGPVTVGTFLAALLAVGSAHAGLLGYVYNTDGTLSVFDTDTDKVKKTIPLGTPSLANTALSVSRDGRRVFVQVPETPISRSRRGPFLETVHLFFIDTAGHRVTRDLSILLDENDFTLILSGGSSSGKETFFASPNGTRLYMRTIGNVYVVDVEAGAVTSKLPVVDSLVARDISRSYIVQAGDPTAPDSSSLSVLDTDMGAALSTIPLPAEAILLLESLSLVSADGTTMLLPAGTSPVSPGGPPSPFALPFPSAKSFIVVDTVRQAVAGRVDLGRDVLKLILSADGRTAYAVTGVLQLARRGRLTRRARRAFCFTQKVSDVAIAAIDTRSLAVIDSLPLGDFTSLPLFIEAPDHRTLYLMLSSGPCNSPTLDIIDLAELRVRPVELGGAVSNLLFLSPLTFSPQGNTLYLSLGRVIRRRAMSSLGILDPTGLLGAIDLGSVFAASAIVTEDGGKAYLSGFTGPFGGQAVEVVDFERSSVADLAGVHEGLIALGGRCAGPLGCFCSADPDCDDGDPCTIDACVASTACANATLGCFPGTICHFEERAGELCPNDAVRRLSARAREKISAAQRAAQHGDGARARTLLGSARQEIRKALSVAVVLLARKRDFLCGSALIFDQLQRLKLLKALTRNVASCEKAPSA